MSKHNQYLQEFASNNEVIINIFKVYLNDGYYIVEDTTDGECWSFDFLNDAIEYAMNGGT